MPKRKNLIENINMTRRLEPAIPGWMRFHDKAAYIVFAADVVFAFGYLTYIGIIMDDRKMYLPYMYARGWLDLNSYSLLPPFFALPVAPLLAWQVKLNNELSEGDFYGIVGTMLGLGAISMFDAVKTIHLFSNFQSYTGTSAHLRNAMHQGVLGNVYKDYTYRLQVLLNNKRINLIFENGRDGNRVATNQSFVFLANPDNRSVPGGGSWTTPNIADRGIRIWTHLIQKDFKCCGASGYQDWDKFNGSIYSDETNVEHKRLFGNYPPSCYCDYPDCPKSLQNYEKCWIGKCKSSADPASIAVLKKRPGCLKFYRDYIYQVYVVTFVLMLIMGLLYLMTIAVCIINFAAIRARIINDYIDDMRTYSLLRDSGFMANQPSDTK